MPEASVIVACFLFFCVPTAPSSYLLHSEACLLGTPYPLRGFVAHLTTTPERASVVAEGRDGFYRVGTRSPSRGTFGPKLNTEPQKRRGEERL